MASETWFAKAFRQARKDAIRAADPSLPNIRDPKSGVTLRAAMKRSLKDSLARFVTEANWGKRNGSIEFQGAPLRRAPK